MSQVSSRHPHPQTGLFHQCIVSDHLRKRRQCFSEGDQPRVKSLPLAPLHTFPGNGLFERKRTASCSSKTHQVGATPQFPPDIPCQGSYVSPF
ncbi:MAG: hypothetical protein A2170_16875 [Deltaproteobacteria bacterium RBG_13_53_10]|nr:MAG: hypothetical protein A2170_16875 [Deltaproteobacteria bacterium RBG_13_53_10]